MEFSRINGIPCYVGEITPDDGVVFVFGSNPEGRHGAGAARMARERFGAVYGRGEGLQGDAYALPTKDLRVRENNALRSISAADITAAVRRMYDVARQNPDRRFCVAYRNTDRASLNGYTGMEMIDMFNAAGPAPANVVFSGEWASTGRLRRPVVQQDKGNNTTQNTMPNINFIESDRPGYPARTRANAEAADITVAIAVDYNTAGERLTRNVAGNAYVAIPIDKDGLHDRGPDGARTEAHYAALEFIEKCREKGLPLDARGGVSLNFAGNGIYTLKQNGILQEDIDVFMTEFVAQLGDMGVGIKALRSGGQTGVDEAAAKAGVLNGIETTVLAPQGWRFRGEDNRDILDEAAFKERFDAVIRQAEEIAPAEAPSWARTAENGFEVSTRGDAVGRRFSARTAKFDEGTVLVIGDRQVDVGGRTIEDVYQTEVKRSGKNLPPAEDSVLFIPEDERRRMSPAEMEDRSYERGYFPLWSVWAGQNPAAVDALRQVSAGRTLTDMFSTTRVTQARAMADVLAGRTIEPVSARVMDVATYEALQAEHPEVTPAAPAPAPVRKGASRYAGDTDAMDLAYSITFGGRLFSSARAEALLHRLDAMDEGQRADFRGAVLAEVDRIFPELRGELAAPRAAAHLQNPDDLLDGIMARASGGAGEADRLEAEIREISAAAGLGDLPVGRQDTVVVSPERLAAIRRTNDLQARLNTLRASTDTVLRTGGSSEVELSSAGDDKYTLHNMTFVEGTLLGAINVGGMTVEDVYWKYVAQTAPGGDPRPGSIVAAAAGAPAAEKDELIYRNGILPLVSRWAEQHSGEMASLKATLRKDSAGNNTLLARITDSSDTRFSAARALMDVCHGRQRKYTRQEIEANFLRVPRPDVNPALTRAALEGYQVYSVGTSTRSDTEFWSLIPEDTDVIVDMRQNRRPQRRFKPGESGVNLTEAVIGAGASAAGIEYVVSSNITGALPVTPETFGRVIADPRVVAEKSSIKGTDPRHKKAHVVYDYEAFMQNEDFQDTMKTVEDMLKAGRKVCFIGSENNAAWSARGLLVGQYLERNTDFHVAHIETTPGGHVRVRSQENIVSDAIGRGKTLRNKDFFSVGFQSDRSFRLPVGEEVVATASRGVDDSAERLRAGEALPANYGTEVEFVKVEGRDYGRRPERATGAWQNIQANARAADFAIMAYTSRTDPQVREMRSSVFYGAGLVIPTSSVTHTTAEGRTETLSAKERCHDDETIIRAAENLHRRLTKSLTWRYTKKDGQKYINLDALKVFVGGSTMPNISTVTQFNENELGEIKPALSNAGLSLVDDTGITQEDVNYFIENVLRRALRMKSEIVDDNGNALPFKVTEISSNFDTGVGEAAITAAQKFHSEGLGVKPVVRYADPVVTIEANDTSRGVEVRDEAMFRNRARGIRQDVTRDILQEQIEAKEEADRQRAANQEPGLSDRQMVALWELGLSNNEILDVLTVAQRYDSVVRDDTMMELLDLTRANGFDIPSDIDDERLSDALGSAQRKLEQWKADGITVVTAASPLYPDNLSNMEDIVERDGAVQRRPAILWAKGDLTLLQKESVAAIHNPDIVTSDAEKNIIKRFTSVAAQNEMPLVTSIDNGAATALDMIDNDGKVKYGRVVGVSSDGIPVGDATSRRIEELTGQISRLERLSRLLQGTPSESVDAALKDLREQGFVTMNSFGDLATPYIPQHVDAFMENKDIILETVEEYPGDGLKDALTRKIEALTAQRAVYSMTIDGQEDIADNIVRHGGLMVSETPPGVKADPATKDRMRPNRLCAGMADACAIIHELATDKPMGILEMAARSVYGVTRGVSLLVSDIAEKARLEPAVDRMKRSNVYEKDKAVQELKPEDIETVEANEEAMQAVVDKASANRETADERLAEKASLKAEVEGQDIVEAPAKARNRIPALRPWRDSRLLNRLAGVANETMNSLMEGFGGEQARKAQATVERLRFGSKTIYVVPEGQPQIVAALKNRFGDGITAVDPFEANHMEEEYKRGGVYVDGSLVERYPQTAATMPLRDPVQSTRLYFMKDHIYTVDEVPNGAMGLPTPAERRGAAAAWKEFQEAMAEMQASFQAQTGFTDAAQLQYRNADFLHVTDNTVEIRRGDEMRCRIWLEDGKIRARNMSLYSDDFQEYHETPTYPVLTETPRNITADTLKTYVEDIRNALYDRPTLEIRAIPSPTIDPAAAQEREEKIANGFLKPRAANIDIAADDVAWAVHEGVFAEKTAPAEIEEKDMVLVYAAATRQENRANRELSSLEKAIAEMSKALNGNESKMDDDEVEELSARISDAYDARRRLAIVVADMQDVKQALVEGRGLSIAATQTVDKKKTMTLSLGGRPVSVAVSNIKKEALDAARKTMQEFVFGEEDIPSETKEKASEKPAEKPVVEATEPQRSEEDELKELGAWLAKAEKDPAMRNTDEYKEKVARVQELLKEGPAAEEKPAEAPSQEQPAENRFSKITSVDGRHNRGYAEDGTFHLLDKDGNVLMDTPLKAIYRPQENIGAVLDAKGKYRFFDYSNDRPIGDVYEQVSNFDDGIALVKRSDGRYNYLQADGSYLSKTLWFDDAVKFSEGKAKIRVADKIRILDRSGKMFKTVIPDKKDIQEQQRRQQNNQSRGNGYNRQPDGQKKP